MSSSAAVSPTTIWLGLDVHKESVTIAVLRGDAPAPDRVDRLPNDLPKLKRYLEHHVLQRRRSRRLQQRLFGSAREELGARRSSSP